MSTPAGWYDDPTPPPGHLPALRYWDGTAWTHHLAPASGRGPTTSAGEELGGWGRRLAAYVVDWLITAVVATALGWPFVSRILDYYLEVFRESVRAAGTGAQPPPQPGLFVAYTDLLGPLLGWSAVVLVVLTCYHVGFLRWRGATPGKLAVGLRVRPVHDVGRLSWGTLARRWAMTTLLGLLGVVPFLGFVLSVYLLLDGLWPLWDAKRQALHDKVARTYVVRVQRPGGQSKMPA